MATTDEDVLSLFRETDRKSASIQNAPTFIPRAW